MGRFDDFYNTRDWKQLRQKKYCDADGLCERCRERGIIKEGREVHHIVPLDEDWSRRLDYSNLILLCSDCHAEVHERDSELQKFERFWEDLK